MNERRTKKPVPDTQKATATATKMTSAKYIDVWEGYYHSHVRASYFTKLADKHKNRMQNLSVLLGVFSCAPVVSMLNYIPEAIGLGAGVCAGVMGVYLSASDLPNKRNTAIQCSKDWLALSSKMNVLFVRAKDGDDVWEEYVALDKSADNITDRAINYLATNNRLLDKADSEARVYFNCD